MYIFKTQAQNQLLAGAPDVQVNGQPDYAEHVSVRKPITVLTQHLVRLFRATPTNGLPGNVQSYLFSILPDFQFPGRLQVLLLGLGQGRRPTALP